MKRVFEKYVKEGAIPTEINGINHKVNIYKKVWTDEEFEQALRNGDLYTKDYIEKLELAHKAVITVLKEKFDKDIERARIEGELLALKTTKTILSNSKTVEDLQNAITGIGGMIAELEIKSKELN